MAYISNKETYTTLMALAGLSAGPVQQSLGGPYIANSQATAFKEKGNRLILIPIAGGTDFMIEAIT